METGFFEIHIKSKEAYLKVSPANRKLPKDKFDGAGQEIVGYQKQMLLCAMQLQIGFKNWITKIRDGKVKEHRLKKKFCNGSIKIQGSQ